MAEIQRGEFAPFSENALSAESGPTRAVPDRAVIGSPWDRYDTHRLARLIHCADTVPTRGNGDS